MTFSRFDSEKKTHLRIFFIPYILFIYKNYNEYSDQNYIRLIQIKISTCFYLNLVILHHDILHSSGAFQQ